MNVAMAMHIFSNRTARELERSGDPEQAEAIKLCDLMNRWWDIMNVRSEREHIHKNKPDVAPFTLPNDERLMVGIKIISLNVFWLCLASFGG